MHRKQAAELAPSLVYDVVKFIRALAPNINTSASTPFTPEELKIDKIVLSWILFTLSDSLHARLVLARPRSAKEVWSLISEIVKDNKRSRTNALKAELRSIKLGDQSMESYFQNIDSIVNILTSLDAHVNDEDVIHYPLEGLPEIYANVCGYMHWKDTFPDLKMVRSLLLTEEMRLKPKVLASSMDSSSPMFFVADSSNNSRPSSTTQGESWKPCFNFAKGNCRFGASCQYVHDANARATGSGSNAIVSQSIGPATTPSRLITYYASLSPTGPTTPPGFTMPAHVPASYPVGPAVPAFYCSAGPLPAPTAQTGPTHYASSTFGYSTVGQAQTPQLGSTTATHNSGQATVLPHTFTARTFQDPSTDAWNMDTGASSHVNNSVTSLSIVLNLCKSYREAFNDVNWHSAMRDEYNALIKNSTWTLVPRPPDVNVVRCMWIFRHKYLADGRLSRYKARLVANGSIQLEGVDVDETFSPVVKPETIRTVVSLAASRHWSVHPLDVKNAFLHRDLSETVYMHQPPGFRDFAHPDYVCLLHRSLYGLKQAPRAWFQLFASYITKEFAMTNLGSLNYFLGISFTRDSSGMFLSQKKYAFEILERAGDVVSDTTLYRSLAGSLQYLTFTIPDISYVVQQLFSSSTTDLAAYSDADWAGCPTTRRSTSGYCVFLGNNLLSWSAKRQPTLSRSSAEAEYRGAADVVLLRLVGYATYCVRVLRVPSRCQFADIFTKGLPTALFEEFRSSLSVRCPPAQTAGEC
ncbi:ribonuclease H-like domain-containing protein [Tanacetum coccineum]|uniref:Ribonuclease H-like domain-containing protein n=1 Tax=Tanacetum coccineum TaxID=301880 RepID=A0ABQ4Z8R8_9ASTR